MKKTVASFLLCLALAGLAQAQRTLRPDLTIKELRFNGTKI